MSDKESFRKAIDKCIDRINTTIAELEKNKLEAIEYLKNREFKQKQ